MVKTKITKIAVLAVAVSFLGVLLFPKLSSADTVADLQAQLQVLLTKIQSLQQQLAQLQGQSFQWCHNFNSNLKYGDSGEEVKALQMALQKEGFYKKAISGYFHKYTAAAVSGFQEKYKEDILAPWGLKYGTGFVGKTTRAKLNELYGCTKLSSIPSTPTAWETYRNEKYGFSFQYPPDWSVAVKENDLSQGSLVSFKFKTGQTWGIDRDEFLGLVGCFAGMTTIDPFYLGDFRATEPLEVDGVTTSIYFDQNRGLETLKFYIPFLKQDDKRCGIFFQSFGNLTEDKKDIIMSLKFTNGFESFVSAVAKQFQTSPPTKG